MRSISRKFCDLLIAFLPEGLHRPELMQPLDYDFGMVKGELFGFEGGFGADVAGGGAYQYFEVTRFHLPFMFVGIEITERISAQFENYFLSLTRIQLYLLESLEFLDRTLNGRLHVADIELHRFLPFSVA